MRIQGKLISIIICALAMSGTFNACSAGACNVVPDIQVTERISLIQYPQLRVAQQSVAIEYGGVAGLIVVSLGNNQYIAYDRSSTVEPHKRCAVEVDGLVTATDPCSGATFILTNGSPSHLAECPLKPYRATLSGETILITN